MTDTRRALTEMEGPTDEELAMLDGQDPAQPDWFTPSAGRAPAAGGYCRGMDLRMHTVDGKVTDWRCGCGASGTDARGMGGHSKGRPS